MCSRGAAHNGAAYDQLGAVLRCLRLGGVAAAPIKGVALARFVYADRALRPFTDLDLLISAGHRAAADRALGEAGYVTAPAGGRTLEDAGAKVYWDPSWHRVPLDVHWRFDAAPVRLGLDYEVILRRAHVVMIGDEPVRVLSPADMIVAACAYFVKHLWWAQPRLRYLYDIAEVTRRFRVDWDRVAETAAQSPMTRSPLRVTLSAAARLTDAEVPAGVIADLGPSRGRFLNRRLSDVTCRRILHRQTWPFKAFVQVAAMRWMDGDTWEIYPKLAAWIVGSRWRRFAGEPGRIWERATLHTGPHYASASIGQRHGEAPQRGQPSA